MDNGATFVRRKKLVPSRLDCCVHSCHHGGCHSYSASQLTIESCAGTQEPATDRIFTNPHVSQITVALSIRLAFRWSDQP